MKRIILASLLTITLTSPVWGQGCSVCTQTAKGLDNKSARGLNGGIVYLALLPLGIMGTLGYFWLKSKNSE